jgi:hypothetical protein
MLRARSVARSMSFEAPVVTVGAEDQLLGDAAAEQRGRSCFRAALAVL